MNYIFTVILARKWVTNGLIMIKRGKIGHLTVPLILSNSLSFLSGCILGVIIARHLATIDSGLLYCLKFSCVIGINTSFLLTHLRIEHSSLLFLNWHGVGMHHTHVLFAISYVFIFKVLFIDRGHFYVLTFKFINIVLYEGINNININSKFNSISDVYLLI